MVTRADVDLRPWFLHPTTPKKDGFNPTYARGGLGEVTGIAALASNDSVLAGIEEVGGTAALNSDDSILAATGQRVAIGTGALVADDALLSGSESLELPAANLTVDTFETADMTPTFDVNGFQWEDVELTSIVTMDPGPKTVWRNGPKNQNYSNQSLDWTAKEGSHCMRFDYPAGEPWSEQRFSIGTPQRDVWFRYWVRIPVNFEYGPGSPNKFIAIWMDGYQQAGDGSTVWLSLHRINGIDATIGLAWGEGNGSDGDYVQDTPFIDESVYGKWVQIAIHLKTESSLNARDGEIQSYLRWEDEQSFTLLHSVSGIKLKIPESGGIDGFKRGYLMGWANAAYSEDTDWLIDTFEVSTESLI